jgi:pSer/pThr/pTyr-binding forkhead associated (FHA) protein
MHTELKIELSLKDRVIETYTCTQPEVIVGRDPSADIVIDNPGISRHHMKFERNAGGTYIVRDLGSTNGIFLNGELIQEEPVRNNDVLVLGKFTMRVIIQKEDASRTNRPASSGPADDIDGTTVLSKEQMARMMADVKLQPSKAAATSAVVRKTPVSAAPGTASASLPFGILIIGGVILLVIATVVTFFVL